MTDVHDREEPAEEVRAARRREVIETVLTDYLDHVDPEEVDTQELAESIAGELEGRGL